jgi:hypothetical protein
MRRSEAMRRSGAVRPARHPLRTPYFPALSLAHERSPFLSPPQDRHEFSQLVTAIRQQYNENAKQIERTWGGGIQGTKSQAATAKLERQIEKEKAKKALM